MLKEQTLFGEEDKVKIAVNRLRLHEPTEGYAEEGAKCLTDIAKIVEEKAKDIDRCHMEGSYETDKPWEEMVLWLRKARECVDSLLVAPGGQNIDMTKPQPCNMFDVADGEAWAKELGKLMYDVVSDVIYMDQFFDCIERADEEALAEKLTEIIKVCTSWIDALGYDAAKRSSISPALGQRSRMHGNMQTGKKPSTFGRRSGLSSV